MSPDARSSRSGWKERPPSTAVARPSASSVGARLVCSNQRDVYACVSSCASIRGAQDSLPSSAGPRTPTSRVQVGSSRSLIGACEKKRMRASPGSSPSERSSCRREE